MINRHAAIAAVLIAGAACARASNPQTADAPAGADPAAPRAAGRAATQPPCAAPDDYTGASMSGTFASRPEPLYAAGSAALRDLGYAVLEHMPPRELITAPSYTWPKGTETEGWHGPEHPGIELTLFTRTSGDSTHVTIGARALCLVRGPGETSPSPSVGQSLESVVTLQAMNALLLRLQRAP
jgi:hypothetical protein